MFISDFAIKKPLVTIVSMVALVVFGLFSLFQLETDEFPDVQQPIINVAIPYPGASPDVVEREVLGRVEEAVSGISGVDRILAATILNPLVRERLAVFVTKENGADLAALAAMIEAGQVRPVIDRTYPLRECADAIRHLETGHARGKIVISV